MPPKKSEKETGAVPADVTIKPEDAEFFLQCLKAFDETGAMDISVVSAAIGHTNVMSTRNTFGRLKKKWGLGNIPIKGSSSGGATKSTNKPEETTTTSGHTEALKPKIIATKVTKKRGRTASKAKESSNVVGGEVGDTTESEA